MSRPFSYNDENFTVIGNLLFCHIEIRTPILKNKPILEIPQAIYDHMLFNNQTFYQVFKGIDQRQTYQMTVSVTKLEGKKYFLVSDADATVVGSYLVGYYILKDI